MGCSVNLGARLYNLNLRVVPLIRNGGVRGGAAIPSIVAAPSSFPLIRYRCGTKGTVAKNMKNPGTGGRVCRQIAVFAVFLLGGGEVTMRTVVALALGLLSQAATAEELSFVCAGASFDVKTRALSLAREETLVIDVKNAAMLWRRWRVPVSEITGFREDTVWNFSFPVNSQNSTRIFASFNRVTGTADVLLDETIIGTTANGMWDETTGGDRLFLKCKIS